MRLSSPRKSTSEVRGQSCRALPVTCRAGSGQFLPCAAQQTLLDDLVRERQDRSRDGEVQGITANLGCRRSKRVKSAVPTDWPVRQEYPRDRTRRPDPGPPEILSK
jgi:hypothetical protein